MLLLFFIFFGIFHHIFSFRLNLVTLGELFFDKKFVRVMPEHNEVIDFTIPFETIIQEYFGKNHDFLQQVFDCHPTLSRNFISSHQLTSSIFFLEKLLSSKPLSSNDQKGGGESVRDSRLALGEFEENYDEPSANLDFNNIKLFLKNFSFSRSLQVADAIGSTEEVILEYRQELNDLKEKASKLPKLELYSLRRAIFFHSVICYDNIPSTSQWQKSVLDDAINAIDRLFQQKYCLGISKESKFQFPSLASNAVVNLSNVYPGQFLPYHQRQTMEPYFYPLMRRRKLANESHMIKAMTVFNAYLAEKPFYNIALMTNNWLFSVGDSKGFEDFHSLLKKLIKSHCLGPLPFISFNLKGKSKSILLRSFMSHYSQILIHVSLHKLRKATLIVDPVLDEIITKILVFALSFLKEISDLFVKAKIMGKTYADSLMLALEKEINDLKLSKCSKSVELDLIEIDPYSSIELKNFMYFTLVDNFRFAKLIEQKYFELLSLYFSIDTTEFSIDNKVTWVMKCVKTIEASHKQILDMFVSKEDHIRYDFLIRHLFIFAFSLAAYGRPLSTDSILSKWSFLGEMMLIIPSQLNYIKDYLIMESDNYFRGKNYNLASVIQMMHVRACYKSHSNKEKL
jgi:hypothetical protein